MKDFPGTPGTLTGLVLRISQCIFTVGSIASMATTSSFFNFTAFCFNGFAIWSFVLALLDVYAWMRKKVLHNVVLGSLFVTGDWGAGWKIVASFDGNFPNRIKQLPIDRHFDISNVKRIALEADGYQPYLISPEKGLRSLIKGVLELAKEPSRLCVDEVLYPYGVVYCLIWEACL
ncbi:hypothetical protein K1719_041676 [Acacia pycnantha]|nr:hypothetical protein K1719_041676 [Acacia pycnantha]